MGEYGYKTQTLVSVSGSLLAQTDLRTPKVVTHLKRDSNEGHLKNYGSRRRMEFMTAANVGLVLYLI